MTVTDFFALFVKFFFLMTPPFVISVFLAVAQNYSPQEKASLALRITVATLLVSTVLLLCGGYIFSVFGITINAFRIGTGAILFLTSVSLVRGEDSSLKVKGSLHSIAVVPMAIPITVGPATVGALVVYGGEINGFVEWIASFCSIALAILCIGFLLWSLAYIEKAIGKNGLVVMSKLTGLILAALSSQMIFDGAKALLFS